MQRPVTKDAAPGCLNRGVCRGQKATLRYGGSRNGLANRRPRSIVRRMRHSCSASRVPALLLPALRLGNTRATPSRIEHCPEKIPFFVTSQEDDKTKYQRRDDDSVLSLILCHTPPHQTSRTRIRVLESVRVWRKIHRELG